MRRHDFGILVSAVGPAASVANAAVHASPPERAWRPGITAMRPMPAKVREPAGQLSEGRIATRYIGPIGGAPCGCTR